MMNDSVKSVFTDIDDKRRSGTGMKFSIDPSEVLANNSQCINAIMGRQVEFVPVKPKAVVTPKPEVKEAPKHKADETKKPETKEAPNKPETKEAPINVPDNDVIIVGGSTAMQETDTPAGMSTDTIILDAVISGIVDNPDCLVDAGVCSDPDTARDIAEKLKTGDLTLSQIDTEFMKNLKPQMEVAGVIDDPVPPIDGVTETSDVAAFGNIPDNIPGAGGNIDFTPFGGTKIDTTTLTSVGSETVTPDYRGFVAQPQYDASMFDPNAAYVYQQQMMGAPIQSSMSDPQMMQQPMYPQEPPMYQQPAPGQQVYQQPMPQHVQQPMQQPVQQPHVTQIKHTKQKAEPAPISIQGIPKIEVENRSNPVVTPDYIQPNVPLKDTHVSLHDPSNDELIAKYSWLAEIERISNRLNQPIKFIELSKSDVNEPNGLVQAIVYSPDGQFCLPKSFTIDASGVMYDKRPKFFPIMMPLEQTTFEDYPAYLILKGGKDNAFNDKDVTAFLTGGVTALDKYSAYKPDWYSLNKFVDLSSRPSREMTSDSRKRVQNRLINAMNAGVFEAALASDPYSRWRFESYDRRNETFTLTNMGTSFRFNYPCFATKPIKIRFKENEVVIE